MDCSPLGFSVHRILLSEMGCHFLLQEILLTWGSCLGGWILYHFIMWEAGKPWGSVPTAVAHLLSEAASFVHGVYQDTEVVAQNSEITEEWKL